ncbi:unnamed protein product [Soboliphyme baturini]|uniref:Death domain-containing protein n=1 Tax=Soboliphyme baturini TaxID=241478 RepID=A0A183IVQ2_9BILA|nr:unnamed protein product [Soboliphyme baturini]
MSAFPVISWQLLVSLLRKDVNPFASDYQCRHLLQQLQVSGEVLYMKDSKVSDLIVLSPNWFCHHILGKILSPEILQKSNASGLLKRTDIRRMFHDVSDISLLMSLLDSVNLCTAVEGYDDGEYEFPALNYLPVPADILRHSAERNVVYGAVRLLPSWGTDSMIGCIFYRVQMNLRRSVAEFKDPSEATLSQWRGCSRLISGGMEGILSVFGADRGIEVKVRGLAEQSKNCFYFLEDLVSIVEHTVAEMAPGLMIEMQLNEHINVRSTDDGDESFVDVVCFGCTEIAVALKLCVDVPISCIAVNTRRELAALLDPQDSMGRDWRILAVKLGLTSQLPDVDCSGPQLSKTDQVLNEWSLQNLSNATIGALLRCLKEIGRQDAIDVLCRSVPLYMLSTTADDTQTLNDSGVASSNSRSNYGTPQRSESTLSNN